MATWGHAEGSVVRGRSRRLLGRGVAFPQRTADNDQDGDNDIYTNREWKNSARTPGCHSSKETQGH